MRKFSSELQLPVGTGNTLHSTRGIMVKGFKLTGRRTICIIISDYGGLDLTLRLTMFVNRRAGWSAVDLKSISGCLRNSKADKIIESRPLAYRRF